MDIQESDSHALPGPMARERQAAIEDLVSHGVFRPVNDGHGPYAVRLSIEEHRLVLRVRNAMGQDLNTLVLALTPYRRLIADYFMMIESYEQARQSATCAKLEAIDMGRRGLHDEGAALFQERLQDKIEMDHATARRFFTLVCILHRAHLKVF